MKITSDLADKVKNAFKSKEYRHAYADEFLNISIATQIKALREQEQRKWTQAELGNRVNPLMRQTRISVMENVNYSSWSINTLRKLAEAFDLRLRVSFESFGSLVEEIEQFDRKALQRDSFDTDPVFKPPVTNVIESGGLIISGEEIVELYNTRQPPKHGITVLAEYKADREMMKESQKEPESQVQQIMTESQVQQQEGRT